MEILLFFAGMLFGGVIALAFLSCMQINRSESRKEEQSEKKD